MANQWYMVEIPRGPEDAHHMRQLQDQYDAIFVAKGTPPKAAMYSFAEPGKPLRIYYSPDAAALLGDDLHATGATPCAAPSGTHYGLLVGHADAADISFITNDG